MYCIAKLPLLQNSFFKQYLQKFPEDFYSRSMWSKINLFFCCSPGPSLWMAKAGRTMPSPRPVHFQHGHRSKPVSRAMRWVSITLTSWPIEQLCEPCTPTALYIVGSCQAVMHRKWKKAEHLDKNWGPPFIQKLLANPVYAIIDKSTTPLLLSSAQQADFCNGNLDKDCMRSPLFISCWQTPYDENCYTGYVF